MKTASDTTTTSSRPPTRSTPRPPFRPSNSVSSHHAIRSLSNTPSPLLHLAPPCRLRSLHRRTRAHIGCSAQPHIWPKRTWIAKGCGRGTFPTRLPGWGVGQTIGVPLVGSLFWALVYGSPRGMDWKEERTVPAASRWLFGRGHEGWCIEAEGVTLPALPTARTRHSNGDAQPNGDGELRKQKVNGRGW